MTERLHLGISTCPNDTFLFHALLEGRVQVEGFELEVELLDVQALNERLFAGDFDVAKASFHAALALSDRVGVLPTGAALGYGNGPLLLARTAGATPGPTSRVLCPGEHTTATLLYRLFHRGAALPEQVVFSDIMPALEAGEADFGVCIHEGRFTYAERGLVSVEDLGERWETETGTPLPLGGIVARRSLGAPALRRVQAALRASLAYALTHRDETRPTLRRYAQELSDEVLFAHVDLYVNERTIDLGAVGRGALQELVRAASAAGLVAHDAAPLEVLGTERLFHFVPTEHWDGRPPGPWRPASLEGEGFCHLSFADQLLGTLRAHFGRETHVTLLELRAERVAEALVVETSRGGAPFPHVYGALPEDAVCGRWDLVAPDGAWRLPDLGDPQTAGG